MESVEAAHGDQPLQKAIAEVVGITAPSLRMDSQVKYGVLARGDAALAATVGTTWDAAFTGGTVTQKGWIMLVH